MASIFSSVEDVGGDFTSMFSDAVRRVSSTLGVDMLLSESEENLDANEEEEEDERKFNVQKAKADARFDAPFQRFKIKPMGRLVTRPIRVEGIGASIRGLCHVRCLIGNGEGFSPHARVLKRTAEFNPGSSVSIVLSKETIAMGKNMSLELQVWRGEGNMHDSSQYLEEDNGEEFEDEYGNIVSRGPIGVASLALDQLTLGVPGTVQLHQQGVPAMLRGTLTLVITYEPPPRRGKGNDISYFKGNKKDQKTAQTGATTTMTTGRKNKKNAAIAKNGIAADSSQVKTQDEMVFQSGGQGIGTSSSHKGIKLFTDTSTLDPGIPSSLLSPSGGYEEAVDEKTGRTYWYNRTTQDRTWIDPNTILTPNLTAPTPRW